jgi:hypothetical protein
VSRDIGWEMSVWMVRERVTTVVRDGPDACGFVHPP